MSDAQSPGAQRDQVKLPPTVMEIITREEAEDSKWMRWSVAAAIVLHVIMFMINWDFLAMASEESDAQQKKAKIYVVKQVKFKPPQPTEMQQIPKPKAKKVPIPDPTPDEPEPIRPEEAEEDIDFIADENLVIGIPDAPPPPPQAEGPIRFVVGGNITEPVKISGLNPIYPEPARRARIQGAVVLECIIGKDGTVTQTTVLRGLPLGLTESAVDAVRSWRFQPSTLNGRPVEVLYILTVRFNLQ